MNALYEPIVCLSLSTINIINCSLYEMLMATNKNCKNHEKVMLVILPTIHSHRHVLLSSVFTRAAQAMRG